MTGHARPSSSALEALEGLLDLREEVPHSRRTGDHVRLGVVGGRSGPRFLVPLDHPDALAPSCLAYLGLRDRRTRVTRGAVGLALRAHLGRLVVRGELTADAGPGSLLAAVAEALDEPHGATALAVAVGIGAFDEVWKPTLQVFRSDGTPAAFVKVGLGPVGEHLVRTEAAALAAWSAEPDPRLVVPDLIAELSWQGLPVAVVAPLPADARRLPPGPVSAWAVRELDDGGTAGRVVDATWWKQRRADHHGHGEVDAILEQIEARHGDHEGRWGSMHGDWVPWNLARCSRGLVAWDWEYASDDAPAGLDEVHGAYQQARVVARRSILEALTAASDEARRLRAADPDDARWLADAEVALLVTRSATLEALLGHPPADQAELLAAARVTLELS
ncbi:MAG: hypothetical protein KDA97_09640 [Acidimicrobiales bacterium]|nr:hypothetical protein [Acidimicrobiales bacterium]